MSYSKSYIGSKTTDFDYAPKSGAITGINAVLDDGNEVFVGTDSNVLNISIPVCNSTVEATAYANWVLNALNGYAYQPYSADGVSLDPAVQIGDGVDIRSTYGGVYARTTTYGRLMRADVSAPFTEEVNHEYPWVSEYERKQDRKYVRLEDHFESELTVQASEISAKVSKLSPSGQTSFSWAMNDSSHVWYSNGDEVLRIDSTGLTVNGNGTFTGEINANSGNIGGCSIVNGVLEVTSANVKSLQIGSNFSVNTNGDMTANNATITGTLNVGGSYITAADMYTGAATAAASYEGWNAAYDSACTIDGYCYGGSGYGYNWNGAKSGYNYATDVYASSFHSSGTSYFNVCSVVALEYYYTGKRYSPLTITVDGTSYHVLGWT